MPFLKHFNDYNIYKISRGNIEGVTQPTAILPIVLQNSSLPGFQLHKESHRMRIMQ